MLSLFPIPSKVTEEIPEVEGKLPKWFQKVSPRARKLKFQESLLSNENPCIQIFSTCTVCQLRWFCFLKSKKMELQNPTTILSSRIKRGWTSVPKLIPKGAQIFQDKWNQDRDPSRRPVWIPGPRIWSPRGPNGRSTSSKSTLENKKAFVPADNQSTG